MYAGTTVTCTIKAGSSGNKTYTNCCHNYTTTRRGIGIAFSATCKMCNALQLEQTHSASRRHGTWYREETVSKKGPLRMRGGTLVALRLSNPPSVMTIARHYKVCFMLRIWTAIWLMMSAVMMRHASHYTLEWHSSHLIWFSTDGEAVNCSTVWHVQFVNTPQASPVTPWASAISNTSPNRAQFSDVYTVVTLSFVAHYCLSRASGI